MRAGSGRGQCGRQAMVPGSHNNHEANEPAENGSVEQYPKGRTSLNLRRMIEPVPRLRLKSMLLDDVEMMLTAKVQQPLNGALDLAFAKQARLAQLIRNLVLHVVVAHGENPLFQRLLAIVCVEKHQHKET
jgi:hypothetical protein